MTIKAAPTFFTIGAADIRFLVVCVKKELLIRSISVSSSYIKALTILFGEPYTDQNKLAFYSKIYINGSRIRFVGRCRLISDQRIGLIPFKVVRFGIRHVHRNQSFL